MAIKRALTVAAVGAIVVAALSTSSYAAVATAEQLFERAETVYRQLRTVDPNCAEDDSWRALSDAFRRVSDEFPEHTMAGDAWWRVATIESLRHTAGRPVALQAAVQAYQTLALRYPANRFAPSAYLRLAELQPATSAQRLRELQQLHPESPEAEIARVRAADMSPDGALNTESTLTRDGALEASPTPASGPSSQRPRFEVEELDAPAPQPVAAANAPTPAGNTASLEASTSDEWGRLVGVRHYSDSKHTRVVFDLDGPLRHQIGEAKSPPRVFVDFHGAELAQGLATTVAVGGTGVQAIRLAVNRPGVVRAVLDLASAGAYSVFTLANPDRIVLDVPSPAMAERLAEARRPPATAGGGEARQLGSGVRRIVIDPGHGGSAPGAIGRSGITEKELTLDISRRLASALRDSHYDVVLTRDGDQSLALEDRPAMATASSADLFVSVHVNASSNRKLSGFETYYLDLATDPTAADTAARENAQSTLGVGELDSVLDEIVKNANKRESRDLAHSIQDSLVLQVSKHHDDVRDLGVKHAPFVVLVGAQMPAVLIECSFVSNADEEARLRDPGYRQQVADAIRIGIENFVARRQMMTAHD